MKTIITLLIALFCSGCFTHPATSLPLNGATVTESEFSADAPFIPPQNPAHFDRPSPLTEDSSRISSLPRLGMVKIGILLVDFPNGNPSDSLSFVPGDGLTPSRFDSMFCDTTTNARSLNRYLWEVSGYRVRFWDSCLVNAVSPEGTVIWWHADSGRNYYRTHDLWREIGDSLARLGIYTHYDGYIYVYAGGQDMARGSHLLPTTGSYNLRYNSLIGAKWNPLALPNPRVQTEWLHIGTAAHELMHQFGLADLYTAGEDTTNVWDFDVMSSGAYRGDENSPTHPCILSKLTQGWLRPEYLRDGQGRRQNLYNRTIKSIASDSGRGYLFVVDSTWSGVEGIAGIYNVFAVELRSRNPQTFDRSLGTAGLAVYQGEGEMNGLCGGPIYFYSSARVKPLFPYVTGMSTRSAYPTYGFLGRRRTITDATLGYNARFNGIATHFAVINARFPDYSSTDSLTVHLLGNNWTGSLPNGLTTWGPESLLDNDVHISGDLTIPAGATLRVNESLTVHVSELQDDQSAGWQPTYPEIRVQGNLEMDGTFLAADRLHLLYEGLAQPGDSLWAFAYRIQRPSGQSRQNLFVRWHRGVSTREFPLVAHQLVDDSPRDVEVTLPPEIFAQGPGTFELVLLAEGDSVFLARPRIYKVPARQAQLTLTAGWNFISSPLLTTAPIGELIASATPGAEVWAIGEDGPVTADSLHPAPGEAFWVLASESVTVNLSGAPIAANRTASREWSPLGALTTACLIPAGTRVLEIGPGSLSIRPVLDSLRPGRGYWVGLTDPHTALLPDTASATPLTPDAAFSEMLLRLPLCPTVELGEMEVVPRMGMNGLVIRDRISGLPLPGALALLTGPDAGFWLVPDASGWIPLSTLGADSLWTLTVIHPTFPALQVRLDSLRRGTSLGIAGELMSGKSSPFLIGTHVYIPVPSTRENAMLRVYDLSGHCVSEVPGSRWTGPVQPWPEQPVPAGRYFYRVECAEGNAMGRMVILD